MVSGISKVIGRFDLTISVTFYVVIRPKFGQIYNVHRQNLGRYLNSAKNNVTFLPSYSAYLPNRPNYLGYQKSSHWGFVVSAAEYYERRFSSMKIILPYSQCTAHMPIMIPLVRKFNLFQNRARMASKRPSCFTVYILGH